MERIVPTALPKVLANIRLYQPRLWAKV